MCSHDQEKREKQVWNKRRQILYTVEKVRWQLVNLPHIHPECWKYIFAHPLQIYSLLLEVQDFEKRFVHAPEEDREALLEQHKTNTMQLCNSLQEKEWDDR